MASPPNESWSCFAAAWRRIESWTSRSPAGPSGQDPAGEAKDGPEPISEPAKPDIPDDLLACRMLALHLDTTELTAAEIGTLREMQRLCAACEHRRQCVGDLGDEFADPAWQNWRDYCPNATTLSMMNALRGCGSRAKAGGAPEPQSMTRST